MLGLLNEEKETEGRGRGVSTHVSYQEVPVLNLNMLTCFSVVFMVFLNFSTQMTE
jgi:hypothetical protein